MIRFGLLLLILGMCGCEASQQKKTKVLRLAVTTSTRDSGLLETILPAFEEQHHARVEVLGVGTGAALKLGEAGDVDVILCHARDQELAFLEAGHGVRHEPVMKNSFVVLGPSSDPAGIKRCSAAEGLALIQKSKQPFVSRGDQSGTHQRELQIWQCAETDLQPWSQYFETGQGMGSSLVIADQKQAYILSDFGTYLKFKSKVDLVPLIRSGEQLENPYGVLVVNSEKDYGIDAELGNLFVDYLISSETQTAIEEYRVGGEVLFHPAHTDPAK